MLWKRQPSNRELLERIESLERRFKTLLADVDEYFHLVRRAENRMIKKAVIESREAPQEGPGDAPIPEVPGLNSRQSQAQQAILARRARLIVKPNGGD